MNLAAPPAEAKDRALRSASAKEIIHILINDGKPYIYDFFFTFGRIFVSGTFLSLIQVDSSFGSNCSKNLITSLVIGVGVEAPAVTATFAFLSNRSQFRLHPQHDMLLYRQFLLKLGLSD